MASGSSILIIDDDVTMLNLFVELFLKEGFYKAMGVATGREIKYLIKEKKPDIVLLDINIEGEDSVKVLGQIKKENPFLPVIILANEANINLAERALKLGASSYIIKSAPSENIVKDVKKQLDKYFALKFTKKFNILVVDDDKITADMVNNFLNQESYNSMAAYNADYALSLVKTHKPSLVFLDIVMPDMDGIRILQHIKEIDGKIKVVMMSGIADKEICIKAVLEGASGYITKPFSLQQLRAFAATTLLE